MTTLRLVLLFAVTLVVQACSPPEDPARVKLRERLAQQAPMSHEEIDQILDHVTVALEKQVVKSSVAGETHNLDEHQRETVLGILTDRRGVFDEGLRDAGGKTLRIFNGPAQASNMEMDAARRLLIDTKTLLPARFEFISGIAEDQYVLDLIVTEP